MDRLAAWIDDDHIGHLAFDGVSGLFAFDYTANWKAQPHAYPLSPCLPFERVSEDALHGRSVRVFFENLLPEGDALDAAATANGLSKSNLFGLMRALGRESAGALVLLPEGERPDANAPSLREVSLDELSQRIGERDHPFCSLGWQGATLHRRFAGQARRLYAKRLHLSGRGCSDCIHPYPQTYAAT